LPFFKSNCTFILITLLTGQFPIVKRRHRYMKIIAL
jgi:hypothetical protein